MKLLTTALLSLPLTCLAADWQQYATTTDAKVFYDPATVTWSSSTTFDVWSRMDFGPTDKDVSHVMIENEINCETHMAKTLFMAVQLRNGEVKQFNDDKLWSVDEGAPADNLLNLLCKKGI